LLISLGDDVKLIATSAPAQEHGPFKLVSFVIPELFVPAKKYPRDHFEMHVEEILQHFRDIRTLTKSRP
jgi:hypothetical protein